MARCEGTTKSGDQCKREARPDSRFCFLHGEEKGPGSGGENDTAAEDLEFLDLAPVLLAGIMAAGLVFLLKGFGKWIPRL